MDILDNASRRYSYLNPDWGVGNIRLSGVVDTLINKGTKIICILNDSPVNSEIKTRLTLMKDSFPDLMKIIIDNELHEKGILTDNFTLDGSMNLTYRGLNINQEYIRYSCDSEILARKRTSLEGHYGE
tara:strand:- start:258 stop:641 length:384 start_codon:yes stop_codon:yes gene_type:complete